MKCLLSGFALLSLTFNIAQAAGGPSIALKASTLGVGVEYKLPLHKKFNSRLAAYKYGTSFTQTSKGNTYSGDLNFSSLGLYGDWHPTNGIFRISVGLFSNSNEITAKTTGGKFTYGGTEYMGEANALVDFNLVAPFLGFGLSSQKQSGLSYDLEIGALFQGSPMLSGYGTATSGGKTCNFNVNRAGTVTVTGTACATEDLNSLKGNLEAEHVRFRKDFEDFEVYPVVSFGLWYRF